ncbi:MAG TPA: double-strand break repair protein AddB [Xanthobacteraceae bacterium]|nr:double-strand break repair protein AddB [Xanthobacteraceae bacterium]
MTSRVFNIPASAPFLPTLIEALHDGRLGFDFADDPLALAAATLYLPTQRACKLMREAFLDRLRGDGAILPRIVAIGDIDEDEIAFAESAGGGIAADALALPRALGGLERKLLLTRLVMAWSKSPEVRGATGTPLVAQTPAAASALADDLARLMDDMTTRNVPWERLGELVPDEFDAFWQLTLRFLQIARERWPEVLREAQAIEPMARRDALIKAETARLARKPDGPVIAAGSTGSIPATADLIAAIARLPHGAVVLPGLDTDLDEDSWRLIAGDESKGAAPAPGHPQFAMQALLARMGVKRDAVVALAPARGRERLISEALRPADATEKWRANAADAGFTAHMTAALHNVSMIEAANPEEETLAVAVALREAVQENKTAALVTSDRALARRVAAALGRWDITAEDSGGEALADTSAGVFARLAALVALHGAAPVDLLALLKHPLLRLDFERRERASAALERAILRGPRPRPGTRGLAGALQSFRFQLGKFHRGEASELHPSDHRTTLTDDALAEATQLVARLATALGPLEAIDDARHPLAEFARRHRAVLAALSKQHDAEAAFLGPEGTKLADAFDEVAASSAAAQLQLVKSEYVELFKAMLMGKFVRQATGTGAQVRILGLLEARLTESDRVVLGGLVEGKWPPETNSDAWLSRRMRLALGLDLPERRIGLSAHDFAQLGNAREVVLSRAAKIGGAPAMPSRFIQRLAALTGERWIEVVTRGHRYLSWARQLDRPERIAAAAQPAPKPPRTARPKSLSVTEIEDWLRDPYTIYAKHVLRLRPLDPVDTEPGAAERGSIIHAAIAEFTQTYVKELPADCVGALIALGEPRFAALEDFPEARAFWWPRFVRIAHWFARWETERRASIAALAAETHGKIEIALRDGTFKLRGVADRIELSRDGRYVILDYKTGAARTEKQVRTGLAPQLTLEAAMLRGGGFGGIAAGGSVAELLYVQLRGGDPAGEVKSIQFKDGTADSQADRALAKLKELAQHFDDDETPYRSLVHPMWRTHYGDYDHLARVKEWSSSGGVTDDFVGGE